MRTLWLVTFLALALSNDAAADSSTTATCYRPDGSQMDSTYQPCNGSAPTSMCCHLGVANNGGDLCGSGATYGLCGITGTQLWRESCTDPTWTNPACLKLCIGGDYYNDDAEITACADGSYCCGSNNATCCAAKQGMFIVNNQVTSALPVTSSSSSSTSTSTTTSSTSHTTAATTATTATTTTAAGTTAASTTAATNSQSSSSRSTAGIAAGVTVGGVVLIGAVAAFFWYRRKKRQDGREQGPIASENKLKPGPEWKGNAPLPPRQWQRQELPTSQVVELA